jgi:DNA modification methylase
MPESVKDRCTKSHEYIFLLSKSPKYYFDNEAIKEPCINSAEEQIAKRNKKQHRENASHEEAKYVQHNFSKIDKIYEKRNKRDVWSVNVKPYKGAHFATYPVELIEPCIKAGCPDGGIVLDPFMGSGTTAQVAIANNKQYLGCELNTEYKYLQDQRIGMI